METSQTERVETRHPVYIIYTDKSLILVRKILSGFGKPEDIHLLKVEYNRANQDTRRTLAILGLSFNDILSKDLSPFFKIAKFLINKELPPQHKISITIPRKFNFKGAEVNQLVGEKIDSLVKAGIVTSDQVHLVVPVSNREHDLVKGYCYLNFDPSVDTETVHVIRAILNRSFWRQEDSLEDNRIFFMAFFQYDR